MRRKITLSTLNELSCVISHDNFCLDRYSNYYRGDKPDVPYFCYKFKWEELFRTIGIKMK